MKTSLIVLISFYQNILSPLLHQLLGTKTMCRYSPTCSQYAKQMIEKHGVLKGSIFAIKRFLSCQPFMPLRSQSGATEAQAKPYAAL